MKTVLVHIHVRAPVERVFDAVSDHESFLRVAGRVVTKVVRPGDRDRNGLGCLREVRAGKRMRYLEEVTRWERPSRFDYLIRESTLPVRHPGSFITFTPRGDGTDVAWTARFEVPVPIVGWLLDSVVQRVFTKIFTALLNAAKVELEAGR